jgi:allantoate deiminase
VGDAPTRIAERLAALYAIGDGGGEGANRVGYSPEEDRAHELAAAWMEDAGLAVSVDAAGNLLGSARADPDIWTGSHLDSVPAGGRFDGAAGVVIGIEAVARAGRGAVVAFRDEERGCNGSRSRVASGDLPRAFVEVHIEQGPILERTGRPVAAVSGLVGIALSRVVQTGVAGHAGTVPMEMRDDALCEAAAFVLRVRDAARSVDGAVATVGVLEVEPGAVNVIPGRVELGVDVRAPDLARLELLIDMLDLDPYFRVEPVAMSASITDVLVDEIERRRVDPTVLVSGAGHDAGILAAAGVPTGMLFVRTLNGGVSHSPEELSSAEDLALATDVLAASLTRL